jgi:hypothetical protein
MEVIKIMVYGFLESPTMHFEGTALVAVAVVGGGGDGDHLSRLFLSGVQTFQRAF